MKLSEHFVLGEFTKSNHPEVYNIPSHVAIENMKRICGWLEVLRDRYGQPIIINSGYRSPQLNKKVGGVSTSNHLIEYAAILIKYSKESQQNFDELFIEKNKYGCYWVHFAVRSSDNRRKISFLNG